MSAWIVRRIMVGSAVHRFAAPILTAILLATMPPRSAWGHGPNQVIQETFVFVDGTTLTIEYRTTFGAILARVKLITADADGDGNLSAPEKGILLKTFSADILSKLKVSIDGTDVDLRYAEGRVIAQPLRSLGDTASILVRFEGGLGPLPAGPHLLRVVDGNFSETVLGHMVFYVRAGPRTKDLNVSRDGRTLDWTFLHSEESAGVPGPQSTAELHAGQHGADETPDEVGMLAGFVQREKLTLGFILVALVIAAGLGAVHALSPGHGKAMVAAYLIGSKGRIRDAVLLGGVVTMTHVSSVIIIGVLALVLTEYLAPQDLYPWLGFASGCLIFVIGYWLLASRALGLGHSHSHVHPRAGLEPKHASGESREHAHSHGREEGHDRSHDQEHDHGHEHDHSHEHGHSHVPQGEVTLWSLLTLGISGGMVPCPSAMVVLLAAVATHRIVFGLILIFTFSIGLAAVLIPIGVLAVTATRFMTRSAKAARWVRALPVFSAGVIMLVGISLAFSSLLSGGVLTAGS
jgi:ABC-type nickel/cobalt efflux system permease component RcnA